MLQTKTKILIIRLSSIGDIVQCSGVPRHFKHHFQNCEIHWVIRSDNRDLIAENPYVTKIWSFDRKAKFSGWLKLCRTLQKENFTHVYDIHNNLRSHILCWFLRPTHFIRRSKNRLKRLLLFVFKIDLFGAERVASHSYISPLQKWAIQNDGQGTELHLAADTTQKVTNLMLRDKNQKWIAVAPMTAWPKKNWPMAHWKALVEKILITTNYSVVILGGPQDQACQELVLDPSRVLSLQGQLSLLESAAAASLCETLIAADTGVLHMAEALGKNVIGLLGPSGFGGPARATSRAVEVKLWCRPCTKDGRGPCVNRPFQRCMVEITPQKVFETIKEVTR